MMTACWLLLAVLLILVVIMNHCSVDAAIVGSHTTHPFPLTLNKIGSNLSQGFVEWIKFQNTLMW
jgi:hypothetical protein